MIEIKINDKISLNYVENIVNKYKTDEIMIIMDNTKFQDSEEIRNIATKYKNIVFSVVGGLSPTKEKFNCKYYQQRTYYNGFELSEIIKIFKSIETKINITWTETQKAMFIYGQIFKLMIYSENKVNNVDCARNLKGLIYNKAVCAGFAMIFKEALDRVGIECHYQNRESSHSWNIAKLDGKYRGLELTWEVCNKSNNNTINNFRYFGTANEDEFYNNKHHDLQFEPEEKRFPIVKFEVEELKNNYKVINETRIKAIPLDKDGIDYKSDTHNICHSKVTFHYSNNKLNLETDNDKLKYKNYVRSDGSSFTLIDTNTTYKGTKKYLIFELRQGEDKKILQGARIYSENELIDTINKESEYYISNNLLSHKRLKTKINEFNGYVGYLGKNHQRFYSTKFEQEELHIKR